MGNSNPSVTAEQMSQVTEEDFEDIQRTSRGYCRAVDGTRSRKRMDGSASVTRAGYAPYGTDDVGDDVAQDAVLRFAKRLGEITQRCAVAAQWIASRAPAAWQYVRRDGGTIVVSRTAIRYWAVRDAAAANGYRLDGKPDAVDARHGVQVLRGLPHADTLQTLALAPCLAAHSGAIFRAAWGSGSGYRTLALLLQVAGRADDLGLAAVFGTVAQALYGGPRTSSSKVQRARDAAVLEWRDLSGRLDAARDELVYRGARVSQAA
ncbi:hypothetical protein AB0Q95_43260 [Streptomyces sp. NPDC059900]|uniref:hypothetical protein n=1 Tax=Streptomyces sp. NPDC059900 TaxID=3155816 RepID=UPI003440858A